MPTTTTQTATPDARPLFRLRAYESDGQPFVSVETTGQGQADGALFLTPEEARALVAQLGAFVEAQP